MMSEEKQLLLQDICARLPYGVKVWYKYGAWYSEKFATSIRLADNKIALSSKITKEGDWYPIEEAGEILIKPYLRPMSSMTEDECIELGNIDTIIENVSEVIPNAPYYIEVISSKQINWLLEHHFDYRGLIERGLAIAVTEHINPYEE